MRGLRLTAQQKISPHNIGIRRHASENFEHHQLGNMSPTRYGLYHEFWQSSSRFDPLKILPTPFEISSDPLTEERFIFVYRDPWHLC